MQTQVKYCGFLLKLLLNFSSGEQKLLLIPKVGPSPSIKNYSCDCQHETMNYYQLKNITFLAVSLSKIHESALSNVIP